MGITRGMQRFTPLIPVLALVWVPTTAHAAAPTCQGHPATLVGKPGKTLEGTPEVDVVVTRGAARVSTGEGDDLVCVTGPAMTGKGLRLDTGAGDDAVSVRDDVPVRAFLGDGDDRYRGGDARDVVFAGYPDSLYFEHIDSGTDMIDTGGGADYVRSSGDQDALSLGPGDDAVRWDGLTGVADGGPGRNEMDVYGFTTADAPAGSWLLDNRARQLTRDGVVRYSWERFTDFTIWVGEPMTIRGSTQDETFEVRARPLTVDAGGGDDEVRLGALGSDYSSVAAVDGGAGRDNVVLTGFRLTSVEASILVDLKAENYRFEVDGNKQRIPLKRVEDAEVVDFPDVRLVGDDSANRLVVRPADDEGERFDECRIVARGRGGADVLQIRANPLGPPHGPQAHCPVPRLYGNGGNDLLTGSPIGDRLLGGPGRDEARGRRGVDVCAAEIRVSCERRP
jgi:Ca2+-binding RTX toxin-like protein